VATAIASQDYADVDQPPPLYPRRMAISPEEKAAWKRIYDQAQQAKLNLRATQVYLLDADGRPLDALRLVPSEKVENLLPFLERAVAKLQPAAGPPVVSPAPQFPPPPAADGDLVLHVTARYLNQQQGQEVPFTPEQKGLGVTGDSWRALPAEDWVVFSREEVARLVPGGEVRVGQIWELNAALLARLLTHFYPQTANTDVSRNVLLRQELGARVVSIHGSIARLAERFVGAGQRHHARTLADQLQTGGELFFIVLLKTDGLFAGRRGQRRGALRQVAPAFAQLGELGFGGVGGGLVLHGLEGFGGLLDGGHLLLA